jgi:CRISPR/Cas system-associated endoribonuclease Cas2
MDSYIAAYDIPAPKRLRVARACEDHGYRKQYGVFCVACPPPTS